MHSFVDREHENNISISVSPNSPHTSLSRVTTGGAICVNFKDIPWWGSPSPHPTNLSPEWLRSLPTYASQSFIHQTQILDYIEITKIHSLIYITLSIYSLPKST